MRVFICSDVRVLSLVPSLRPSRSLGSTQVTPPESSVPSLDQGKDRVVLLWFAVFGLSLLFRPAVELAIRVLFFLVCTLLIGTLDGSLNLLVGHAVLRAAKYNGYDPPLLSSMESGSLGGIIVIGPTTLATVCLIALLGGPKLQRSRALSIHVTFLLELLSVVAVSAAACSLGVTIGALGACL